MIIFSLNIVKTQRQHLTLILESQNGAKTLQKIYTF